MRRRENLWAVVIAVTTCMLWASSAAAQESVSPSRTQKSTQKAPRLSRQYSSKYRLRWKSALGYQTFESLTDSSTIASGGLTFDSQGKLANQLFLRANAQIRFESGSSQSLYREIDQNNGFFMREAYADFRPWSFLSLKAGAISQQHLDAPLLVSGRSFPAATEKLVLSNQNAAIILKAQQAIPTSASFDQERSDKEVQASFHTQTVEGRAVVGNFLFKGFVTNYQFNNLPTKVAFESSLYGNTVPDDDIGNSQFVFDYAGRVMGIEGTIKFGQSELIAGIQSIENTEAPEKFNTGRLGFLQTNLALGDDELQLRAENFFNESDSSVAYYNSAQYGHNNRVGYAALATYMFNNRGFAIKGAYINSDVINIKALESREEKVLFQLETFFEDI